MKKCISFIVIAVVLFSCFALPSSAAAPLETQLSMPSNFLDAEGLEHDFFCIFNDTDGMLVELVYDPLIIPTIRLLRSDLRIAFNNSTSSTSEIRIIFRTLTGGSYFGETYMPLSAGESYEFFYNSIDSELTDKVSGYMNYVIPYSNFLYYFAIPDHVYLLSVASNVLLIHNTILWREAIGYDLVSPLFEPVADSSNSFIVLQSNSNALLINLSHRVIDSSNLKLDYQLVTDIRGNYQLYCYNRYQVSVQVYMNIYDVRNGFFINTKFFTIPALGQINLFDQLYANLNVLTFNKAKCYGAALINTYEYIIGLPTIQWAYDQLIFDTVGSSVLLILSQLYQINGKLASFEDGFYDEMMMVYQYFEQLLDIYNGKGESYTQPPTDALDVYLSDESKVYDVLPTGMVENIDSAFGSADVVFSGNGAFGLIRGLMQGLVFDVPKLSGFVFFALAIGIAVLILGRKVNSA